MPDSTIKKVEAGWLATKAPIHTILWRGCMGKPDPRAARTFSSASPSMLIIRATALRSGTVSRSQAITECSDMRSFVVRTGFAQ